MYESTPAGNGHECANCGALLPVADAHGTRTCTFCKAVFQERRPRAAEPAAVSIVIGGTAYDPSSFDPSQIPNASTKRGCGVAQVLALAVISLTVALPLFFVWKGGGFDGIDFGGTAATHSYRFSAANVVLPGEPNAVPSFVVANATYESSKTNIRVMRFDNGSSDPRWTSSVLPVDNDSGLSMLQDGTNVYVAAKETILAFKLTDGTAAWQATLSDAVSRTDCADCFVLAGGRVIARTADGTVQAFDAASGAPAWNRRTQDVNAKLVHAADTVVLLDGKGGDYTLTALEPANGAELGTLPASCARPGSSYATDLDSWSVVQASPAGDTLIVALGTSPACVQGWDPRTATLAWNVYSDDNTNFGRDDFHLLDSPAGLIVTGRDSIALIDPGRTVYRTILKGEQTTYLPIAATGDAVIAEVKNSRGTVKTSVQSLSLVSGEQKWEVSTGKAGSIDGQEGEVFPTFNTSKDGTFTAHVADGKLSIVIFATGAAYESTLTFVSADATTGAEAPRRTAEGATKDLIPDFGPATWSGTRVLVRVGDDSVQLIDAAAATVVAKVS